MQKVCIVTGGANGIGRCITEKYIEQGFFVYVIDTDSVSGNKLKKGMGTPHSSFMRET